VNQDLDIALLRTFVAIVDTGGLTSAGRRVGRTQPAISQQIDRLEEIVGRTLFTDRRKMDLTRDGLPTFRRRFRSSCRRPPRSPASPEIGECAVELR
jgi:DNA-binding transcriptional LysR family regulator